MNNVDKQYLDLLKDILENGSIKETRSGNVRSVFGRTMRFNLSEGLPILTTKKVFTKGVIHELLWFLKGETNIKYLIDNNVNIWTDDAYRHYKMLIEKHNEICEIRNDVDFENRMYMYEKLDENHNDLDIYGTITITDSLLESDFDDDENDEFNFNESEDTIDTYCNSLTKIECLSKEEFVEMVKNEEFLSLFTEYQDNRDFSWLVFEMSVSDYRFGDLGPVYGKQWREQGQKCIDQIQTIIDTLNNNPDDRRMICMAWNTNDFDKMALPPCHYGFQIYTRELNTLERLDWLCKHSNGEYDEWTTATKEKLDALNVPKRELSLMFSMRSNDLCCGNPYNIAQYGMLAYMFCEICNMVPGELIYNGGDIHVYENHIKNAMEQLSRKGSDKIPTLKFARKINKIDDFRYEDFIIEGYEPDDPIKYELNVGL